jgi:lysophospholipase L1-like esterase
MLSRTLVLVIAALGCAAVSPAAAPADSTKPAPKKRVKKKHYRSSSGGPTNTASATSQSSKRTIRAKLASIRRKVIPKGPPVSVRTRQEAHEGVFEKVANAANLPIENAAALVPFFEQLYRHQQGELPGPLTILHYGDSHTAADEWTGDLRAHFQEKFGDGGSGYSYAGRPWNGYRREDVRSGSTRGWHTDGLVGRTGDGVYGLGGVSMSASAPHQSAYLLAEGQRFELFYLQQPGGGALQIYDNGSPVERISTDGEAAPGYYRYETEAGTHRLEVETLDHAPVRLFGWVAEKATGLTYETLGINGAQASMILDWNEPVLRSNIERRNPALIVLAYGTNEAGRKDWTLETYREMFSKLIQELRAAAPTATILVVGPPDRYVHTRKGWLTMENVDMIVDAQRLAAAANGCAFWDWRAKMGGKGSMQQWVVAGMAQYDHVHFTGPGYKMVGDGLFRDLMSQYDVFLKARTVAAAGAPETEPAKTAVGSPANVPANSPVNAQGTDQ